MNQPCSIPLDQIITDRDVWPRERLDTDRVAIFADLFGDDGPDALPPLELVAVGGDEYLLTDGWHRFHALDEIEATAARAVLVTPNPGEDPWAFAYRRGLETCVAAARPLNQTERRIATERILAEHPDWTDVAIARLTGVSNATVGRARRRVFNEQHEATETAAPSDEYVRTLNHQDVSRSLVRGLAKLWEARPLLMAAGLQDSARLGDTLGHELVAQHGPAEAAVWAERMRRWADRALFVATHADSEDQS